MTSLSQQEFSVIADFLKHRSGLSIGYDKLYLLENRLLPLLRDYRLADLRALAQKLRGGILEATLADAMVEAMTINESMFFRDQKPFQQLCDIVLPDVIRNAAPPLRIWSAACSTGQEAYSVAMSLLEHKALLDGITTEIVATDIASHVVARARKGIYTQFEVQRGLPIALLMKYFSQRDNNQWQINEQCRNMVSFDVANLITSYEALGMFDIILCRNVLIYFDDTTRAAVLHGMADALRPRGYLFLGSSETILSLSAKFSPVEDCPGLFRRI